MSGASHVRHVVIMAGGSGRRFWPASREAYPKQFLTLWGNRSLLQYAYQRACRVVHPRNIWISTRSGLELIVQKQIPILSKDRVIIEPVGRDTAPSIALSCSWIMKRDPEATVMFLPADHYISPTSRFATTAARALHLAERTSCVVTIGIPPTYPSTGYGYIRCDLGREARKGSAYSVLSFTEKPDSATAKRYLKEGNYFWNSGIFIAKASVMMGQLQKHAPQIFKLAENLLALPRSSFQGKLKTTFQKMPKVSFDYAVMEKSTNLIMVPAEFEWTDLGSWSSLDQLPHLQKQRNVSMGPVVVFDSEGNIVSSGRKLVVLIDVRNLVVAVAEDAVLVCRKESAQRVKEAVARLRRRRYAMHT
nr:mannose-1-phosphate guanylyltransferase [Candidatus Njordarchaeum guaymaensis]